MIQKRAAKAAPSAEASLKEFSSLRGLKNLPDSLIEAHLKLYAGYVKNLNLLRSRLEGTDPSTPEGSEMQRRIGFEINGARLHELYFENLAPGGTGRPRGLESTFTEVWNSFDAWETEFRAIGQMRGIGWAILYRDPRSQRLSNHWIGLHEVGHPAGFTPVLVMDVWEHAYTGMERPKYIDAFFANLNWEAVEGRLRT